MLIACWSAKGGSGTTVVSVALAGILARTSSAGALLADFGGDVPTVLGMAEPSGPGLGEWLASGTEVTADALTRLEIPGPSGLRILAAGSAAPAVAGRAEVLAALPAGSRGRRPATGRAERTPGGEGCATTYTPMASASSATRPAPRRSTISGPTGAEATRSTAISSGR